MYRSVNFRDAVLWELARRVGLDPEMELLVDQARSFTGYINAYVRKEWDAKDWPEWTDIAEFTPDANHLVPYVISVFPNAVISRVWKMYLRDPNVNLGILDSPFYRRVDAVHCGFEHGTSVWLKYIATPPPTFTSDEYDPLHTYNHSDLTYSPFSGETYMSLRDDNLGADPAFHGILTPTTTQPYIAPTPDIPLKPQISRLFMTAATPVPPDPPVAGTIFAVLIQSVGVMLTTRHIANGTESLADILTILTADIQAQATGRPGWTFTANTTGLFMDVTFDGGGGATGYFAAQFMWMPFTELTMTLFNEYGDILRVDPLWSPDISGTPFYSFPTTQVPVPGGTTPVMWQITFNSGAGTFPPNPPPSGAQFAVTVFTLAITAHSHHTADGNERLEQIVPILADQLGYWPGMNVATDGTNPPVNFLTVALIQAYTPDVPASPGQPQITNVPIVAEDIYPGATYRLNLTDQSGAVHSVSYVSQPGDGTEQVIRGLIAAISAAIVSDPFFVKVTPTVDSTGTVLILTISASATVKANIVLPTGYWELVPFPFALVDAVLRGAMADAKRELGQDEKAAPEEQAAQAESQRRAAAFVGPPFDPLSDQQQPRPMRVIQQ